MDMQYSSVLDPSSLGDLQGLCNGLEIRLHNDHQVEDLAIIRAHEDWEENVGPIGDFKGIMHPRHSLVSICMPGCLPERLDIVAYANEFGFFHDDLFEDAEHEKGEASLQDVLEGFQTVEQSSDQRRSGKTRLQSALILKMLSIDRERALTVVRLWKEYLASGGGAGDVEFDKLDDYIEYRIQDIGTTIWTGFVTFGCAITIPEHEQGLYRDLCRYSWIASAMTNDLCSWDKERRFATENNKLYVSNAIWVIMQERSVGLEDAKEVCRALIRKNIEKHLDVVKNAKDGSQYSPDLVRFLDAMTYTISGNVAWSMSCPRYNIDAQYSPQQQEWMANGIPDHLRREKRTRPLKAQPRCTPLIQAADTSISNSESASSDSRSSSTTPTTPSELCFSTNRDVFLDRHLSPLSREIIDGPSSYIASLPGKGIRNTIADALNVWYSVPESTVTVIKRIVDQLHRASLMLDDIQDGSRLRRGKPATHTVFGVGQTINSSSYGVCGAMQEALKLGNTECARIVVEESERLYVGQSHDLHWTANLICPSVGEYIRALDDKTGGLVRMLARLLEATSPLTHKPNLHSLITMLGRAYALRDDYMNLASTEYTQTKGFCEDLDEGKYSLPVIHALQNLPGPRALILSNMLTQRRMSGKASPDHKQLILDMLSEAGSVAHTLDVVRLLQDEVDREIEVVERQTGMENLQLRAVIELIRV